MRTLPQYCCRRNFYASLALGLLCLMATTTLAQTQPLTMTPASPSFHKVPVGSSKAMTVTLTNTGATSITVNSDTISAGFSVSSLSLPLTLNGGKSTTFILTFAPTSSGNASGQLSMINTGPVSPFLVSLSGEGIGMGSLSASPTSLNFTNVVVGQNQSQFETVTNTGGSNVTLTRAGITGTGFSYSGLTFPYTLSGGGSVTFSVVFTPQSTGTFAGNMAVIAGASNAAALIALSGTSVNQHSVGLTWDPSTSQVSGYNVYRGTISGGPYSKVNGSLDPTTSYTDSSVSGGNTYYYVTTAVDSGGDESTYSNQVQATIPSP
jgi:Abnormal spindle-like microcephaly-assoc'd, ASPM-SPD-2-Hydin